MDSYWPHWVIYLTDIIYKKMKINTCYTCHKCVSVKSWTFWKTNIIIKIDWLIDWCLTPTLAIFQLYPGINKIESRAFFFICIDVQRYQCRIWQEEVSLHLIIFIYVISCPLWWETCSIRYHYSINNLI